jgi:hypothetical protein
MFLSFYHIGQEKTRGAMPPEAGAESPKYGSADRSAPVDGGRNVIKDGAHDIENRFFD